MGIERGEERKKNNKSIVYLSSVVYVIDLITWQRR